MGLGILWAALVGVSVQFFLNMEIERYTLATGETAAWTSLYAWARPADPWSGST